MILDLRTCSAFLDHGTTSDGSPLAFDPSIKQLYLPVTNESVFEMMETIPKEFFTSVEQFGICVRFAENNNVALGETISKIQVQRFGRQCTTFSIFFEQYPSIVQGLHIENLSEKDLEIQQWLGLAILNIENVFRFFFMDPTCLKKFEVGLYQRAPQKQELLTSFRSHYQPDKADQVIVSNIRLDYTSRAASRHTLFHILFPHTKVNQQQWKHDLIGIRHLCMINFNVTDATLLAAMIDDQIYYLCHPKRNDWKPSEMTIEIQNGASNIMRSPRFAQLLMERQCHLRRRGYIPCTAAEKDILNQVDALRFKLETNLKTAEWKAKTIMQQRAAIAINQSDRNALLVETLRGTTSVEEIDHAHVKMKVIMGHWMPSFYCRHRDLLAYRKCNDSNDAALQSFDDAWSKWFEEKEMVGTVTTHAVPGLAHHGLTEDGFAMVNRDLFLRHHYSFILYHEFPTWIHEFQLGFSTQFDPASLVDIAQCINDTSCVPLSSLGHHSKVNGLVNMGLKIHPVLLAADYFSAEADDEDMAKEHLMISVYRQLKHWVKLRDI